ncbi:NUDIX hydrolase [Modicisalibacter tunisiensis]|uniref:NUDIX domain-containing protein n=1 Tax=Modicisalibacter tunisiensis TaxID=390637 RepID=UPI001CCD67CD|nr:NUDIX hydrolase [Modicisalibacter tunisiensis]MBZ9538613.1 NUDIX hydrolase [Modicisalibacter tunisiensis]
MSRWSPRVTVATVIPRDDRFLLVEEDRGGPVSVFNQPAGHLEPGERLTEAARRETREETARDVTITDYLGLYIFTAAEGLIFHSHGFIARPGGALATPLDHGILGAHWLCLEEIESLAQEGRLRSPLVLTRIRDYHAGRRFPLSVIHEA